MRIAQSKSRGNTSPALFGKLEEIHFGCHEDSMGSRTEEANRWQLSAGLTKQVTRPGFCGEGDDGTSGLQSG